MSETHGTPAAPLRAMAGALQQAGVRDVVICPGSRSTPLALALRAAPGLRCWVHIDERAGAFFALGAAKAARRPAAILATSGTAVVNFAPAVAEARYGRVPLLLLTADRPAELHDRGAPQTIDQEHLYGRHAKWYAELPVPEASAACERDAREVVARAAATAVAAPAGPVQLDLPFREPLLPEGSLSSFASPGPAAAGADEAPGVVAVEDDRIARVAAEDEAPGVVAAVGRVAGMVAGARRPMLVCGPIDVPGFADAVARLAAGAGLPILADGLSNLRTGPHDRSQVIGHHDALLRTAEFRDAHLPDFVLRFGAPPTSKLLNELLDGLSAPQVLVAHADWNEPTAAALTLALSEPATFARVLADSVGAGPGAGDAGWLASWQAADAAAAEALRAWAASLDEPFEGAVGAALTEAASDGITVVVGNSMPVRDLDAFLPSSGAELRLLGNRGANGIDGVVSTALGAAAAQERPVVVVVGDLSLLHDLGGLVAAKRLGLSATVVLVNNDGGGIFSFLPQGQADDPGIGLPRHYEELFGTPHGIAFGPLVAALGADYEAVDQRTLGTALAASVQRPGVQVLELCTERARNVELHREAMARAAAAVEALA